MIRPVMWAQFVHENPGHRFSRPATTKRRGRAGVCWVLILCATHASASPGFAGKWYPSERFTYKDKVTGRTVVQLTRSPADDQKIYQTHPSWTADGEWIVFRSDRTGRPQLFAVRETTGDLVQLTATPQLQAGQVCLSRKRMELLTVIGPEIVRLKLKPLLTQAGRQRRKPPPNSTPQVLGTIPAGARLSGTMSWDADEKELYLGLAYPDRPTSRRWAIVALNLHTGRMRTILEPGFRVGHVQANPFVPGWIMYCHETGGDAPQRMWLVRADGSNNRPFYKETYGEWVTHEVWWDAQRAIFTIWPKDEAMRRKPYGLASVSLTGQVTFHSQYPYWHVTAVPDCRYAVADTFAGELFQVDLNTGEKRLLTQGHRIKRKGAHPHQRLSRDGTRVLFNTNRDGNSDLAVVRLWP